ncbi:hypothetical protein KW790_02560 [Candidatus Parcubacteria bacterium]|nr:hypothetical protein [Candidatus Parcubacteria bacterium]
MSHSNSNAEITVNELGEQIWQRGNARKIMKEARVAFKLKKYSDPVGAHVKLASVHYSLVKRYMSPWWKLPLAVWHLRRAVVHAWVAYHLGLNNFDQIDVVSRTFFKAPEYLGGDINLAHVIVTDALFRTPLNEPMDEIPYHTRALLLVTQAEIEEEIGELPLVGIASLYMDAIALRPKILKEKDEPMAMRQWIRVATSTGLWFFDHIDAIRGEKNYIFDDPENVAYDYLIEAYNLAEPLSTDQALKILTESQKRGIDLKKILKPRPPK